MNLKRKYESFSPEMKAKIEKRYSVFKKLSLRKRNLLVNNTEKKAKVQNAKVIEKRVENRLEKKVERRQGPRAPRPLPATTPAPKT